MIVWYEQSVSDIKTSYRSKRLSPVTALSKALDVKYGDLAYEDDLRYRFTTEFITAVKSASVPALSDKSANILVCGPSLKEIETLSLQGSKLTLLDLSKRVLEVISEKYPEIHRVLGTMNHLPFAGETFDLYLSLRAIQSSNVDVTAALDESLRVTKVGGKIVFSVSNGYLLRDEIVTGMYSTKKGFFDADRPRRLAAQIESYLGDRGQESHTFGIHSEIFIYLIKR